ncbi:nucleotide exchange factor GrpE [Pseudonocardia endophytica]|uniref:Protein GrpE n=1 Tax=Pseudonocardia endophytica TaxID=401976 RepID=A0A4R1I1J1_PSEEN|nr:nucleotide exchange factor GrpE [Pseudonocardia endophytica]TCK27783.1 molecular chaperone GrpE [Pseudonocardia endophytica]
MNTDDRDDGTVGGHAEGQDEPVTIRDRRKVVPEGTETPEHGTVAGDGTAAPGPAAGPADGVDPEVEKLTAEVAERTADLQRVSAEYANYRRRTDRERESVLVGAKASFVSDLLTVLDDFERAEQHGDLTGAFKSAADKVVGVVTKLGLEPFGVQGELFDPSLHEAVQHEPSDASGPTVTVLSTVLRRGYRISDRVLRPAMVTVQDRAESEVPAETTAETVEGGAEPPSADGGPGGGEPQNPA